MEKKERTPEQKLSQKKVEMNKNMFNFIKGLTNVQPQMPATNVPDPNAPDKYIPDYKLIGKAITNKEFSFEITIDNFLNENNKHQVYFIINQEIKFKVNSNSELRFILENYEVPETITLPEPETITPAEETKQSKKSTK